MSMPRWAAQHRRSILFLLAVLALAGAASALRLPVALFPHVNFPRIVVSVDAGDRPAEQMVVAVTRPVEQAVRAVPGVRRSAPPPAAAAPSYPSTSRGALTWPLALQQVDSAVNQALPSLPAGTSFTARRMDPTVFPVAAYSLTSTSESPVQLRDIAKYQLLPLLSAIDGVARIGILGGAQREYHVYVDPAQLQAHGLTMDAVARALSASNVLQAVGRLQDHYKLYLLLSDTRFHDPAQIRHTVLQSGENGLVELGDIATVRLATEPQWMRVTANGRDAVSIQVYQQPGGNTVKIVKAVQARLADVAPKLPANVRISQLVRPERAHHQVGHKRARRHRDRGAARGTRAARLPA